MRCPGAPAAAGGPKPVNQDQRAFELRSLGRRDIEENIADPLFHESARSGVFFLRGLRVLRGQNPLTTKSTKHTKFGSFFGPRSQRFLAILFPWRPLRLCA